MLRAVAEQAEGAGARLQLYVLAYAYAMEGRALQVGVLAATLGIGRTKAFELAGEAKANAVRTMAERYVNGPRTAGGPPTPTKGGDGERSAATSRPPRGHLADSVPKGDGGVNGARTAGGPPTPTKGGDGERSADSDQIGSLPLSDLSDQDGRDRVRSGLGRLFQASGGKPDGLVGARFGAILRYWSGQDIPEQVRWVVDPAADVAWFESEVVGAYPNVDGMVALAKWDDWLRRSYLRWNRNRNNPREFVRQWRVSVTNAFRREAERPAGEDAKGAKSPAPQQGASHVNRPRGTYDQTPQRFDVPVVPDDGRAALAAWRALDGQ